jgi:hypothetical protein
MTKETVEKTEFSENAMCVNESKINNSLFSNLKYLIVGVIFGITFVKAEIISSDLLHFTCTGLLEPVL